VEEGIAKSQIVRQAKADEYAGRIYAIIKGYQDEGMSLNGIARKLTADEEPTPRGKDCKWTPTAVKNVLERIEK
jgi:hypothetical protein